MKNKSYYMNFAVSTSMEGWLKCKIKKNHTVYNACCKYLDGRLATLAFPECTCFLVHKKGVNKICIFKKNVLWDIYLTTRIILYLHKTLAFHPR